MDSGIATADLDEQQGSKHDSPMAGPSHQAEPAHGHHGATARPPKRTFDEAIGNLNNATEGTDSLSITSGSLLQGAVYRYTSQHDQASFVGRLANQLNEVILTGEHGLGDSSGHIAASSRAEPLDSSRPSTSIRFNPDRYLDIDIGEMGSVTVSSSGFGNAAGTSSSDRLACSRSREESSVAALVGKQACVLSGQQQLPFSGSSDNSANDRGSPSADAALLLAASDLEATLAGLVNLDGPTASVEVPAALQGGHSAGVIDRVEAFVHCIGESRVHGLRTHLSRLVFNLLSSGSTGPTMRARINQLLSQLGLDGKATWIVQALPYSTLTTLGLDSTSAELALAAIRDEFVQGSLALPLNWKGQIGSLDALWAFVSKMQRRHAAAFSLDDQAEAAGSKQQLLFACRQSSATTIERELQHFLLRLPSDLVLDVHPLQARWLKLRGGAAALRLLEQQSVAEGSCVRFPLLEPNSGSGCCVSGGGKGANGGGVILIEGSDGELAKTRLVELLNLDSLVAQECILGMPGALTYFTSAEGAGALSRIEEDTKTIILYNQPSSNDQSSGTGQPTAGNSHAGKRPNYGCADDDRWCCLWKGTWIVVCHAEATKLACHALVVPAGSRLQPEGAAAESVVRAGGHSIEGERSRSMPQNGASPGTMAVTGAGRLPCKALIHAVGPLKPCHSPEAIEQQLQQTVDQALRLAAKQGHSNVALLGFYGGNNACSVHQSAQLLVSSVKRSLAVRTAEGQLSRVLLVDSDPAVIGLLRTAMTDAFASEPRSILAASPAKLKQANLKLAALFSPPASRVAPGVLREATADAGAANTAAALTVAAAAAPTTAVAAAAPTAAVALIEAAATARGAGLPLMIPLITAPAASGSAQTAGSSSSRTVGSQKSNLTISTHVRCIDLPDQEADVYVLVTNCNLDFACDLYTNRLQSTIDIPLRCPPGVNYLAEGKTMAFVVPAQYNLRCANVVLASCPLNSSIHADQLLRRLAFDCLVQADNLGAVTIAMPPLGSSYGSFPVDKAAGLLFQGIADFRDARPQAITRRIIITVPTAAVKEVYENSGDFSLSSWLSFGRGLEESTWRLDATYALLLGAGSVRAVTQPTPARAAGSATDHLPSSAQVVVSASLNPEVTMTICGGSVAEVKQAVQSFIGYCKNLLKPLVICEPQQIISILSSKQVRELAQYVLTTTGSKLQMERLRGKVCLLLMCLDHDAANRALVKLTKVLYAEQAALANDERLTSTTVWQHKYGSKGAWINYCPALSRRLEDAYVASWQQMSYSNDAGVYCVDFACMRDYRLSAQSDVAEVQRVSLESGYPSLPFSTDTVCGSYLEVTLNPIINRTEYNKILSQFSQTMARVPHQVVEIVRIQNPTLWRQYCALKKEMSRHVTGLTPLERQLWHGAPAKEVEVICRSRFNRSHFDANGMRFGHGVYFARSASYSAQPMFSIPDSDGIKRVIYSYVLVGDFEQGHSNVRVTNFKPFNPLVRFDTTVDCIHFPSIFVVYHDAQAYPAYVIKFR